MAEQDRTYLLEQMVAKGWMPYEVRSGENIVDIVSRGAASSLEVNLDYLTLCATQLPNDFASVNEEMTKRIPLGIVPLAKDGRRKMLLAHFSVLQNGIVCHANGEKYYTYEMVRDLIPHLESSELPG